MTEERGKAEIRDLAAEAGSLTEFAFRQIRADIIAGRFPSGIKLHLEDLKARYGLSASPLREALARLVSQGFVQIENQNGRAHVCTPVTNAHFVCRLLLEKKKDRQRV